MIIHRSSVGCIERTMAYLLEHTAGALPLWLAPEQIWIIPIGKEHVKYAKVIGKEFQASGFRFQIKDENETVGKKIREGEIQKIPYILAVGEKEIKTKSVGVRQRGKGDIGMMKLSKFLKKVIMEAEKKDNG